MNISPELIISILALLISMCSLSTKSCKCNKPTEAAPDDNEDMDKMSWLPCGNPKRKEILFILACVFASVLLLQGTEAFFAVIGLPFTNNGYVSGTCFIGMFFAFQYCDSLCFHYLYPANKNNDATDDSNHTLPTAKDWQWVIKVMACISIGAFIIAVASAVIAENVTAS